MPKEKKRSVTGQSKRHAPLGQVIQQDEDRGKYAISRNRSSSDKKSQTYSDAVDTNQEEGGEGEEQYLDERTSRKILELGREQRMEMESEELEQQYQQRRRGHNRRRDNSNEADSSDEEQEENVEEEEEEISILQLGNEEEQEEEILVKHDAGYVTISDNAAGLSAEEEKVVAQMMGNNTEERRTLADIIMEKIAEKEAQQKALEDNPDDDNDDFADELPPKVVQVYTDIGRILSRYTAGKLPKAFKVIPSLSNWEEVLYLTRPDQWTPQAMFAATRIFASNLNPKMAQRFYNLVLLDSVRADIDEHHKLNYHYYMSLKKAIYKPSAFFKGILLPLCKENCTLREAAIVASVLQRVSIPVHHSAVAIHKLAQMEYSGATSIFLKTLLNKKYSLPSPVIGSMVRHFASFMNEGRKNVTLPVLWHQCLLVFVQRYKNEVQDESREALRLVMKVHYHPKITPEIRRELFGLQAFKEERAALLSTQNQKDMMMTDEQL
mmetsp:Transcript_14559/g.20766  ORF Transcript_14559/g.20766 Transcript_14559/m.20766 type:complete len:494 (-) Transcript_14559:250-1731(-)|eukprot:CAMPEP_0184859586 /NCGR_PEP_ID=MMETSP0580-20130426/4580_1 /TAXON_ID=1118495 /ORGANISM="Dactyliosolen fragilissimus" /LENGTH=493 /DNA_ID=CAMNT_0027356311 /DNA_START=170 /DNA_END=1651 /DNA_ORIENTATION=-